MGQLVNRWTGVTAQRQGVLVGRVDPPLLADGERQVHDRAVVFSQSRTSAHIYESP